MAIAAFNGLACNGHLAFRRPLIYCVHKARECSSLAAVELLVEPANVKRKDAPPRRKTNRTGNDGDYRALEWKKLGSGELGIQTSMIASSSRFVLNELRKKGYDVYLVGGCVRDLILHKTPKDFDIITSAELKEVLRTFPQSEVIGKRFPICHVHVEDIIVEVASFSTVGRKFGRNSRNAIRKPSNCDEEDFIRWKNCLNRDFTINGLMFDPFARVVYDYTGGLEDIRRAKVRSIIPAGTSFVDDCARILRGVRIAARLGFRFAKETAYFVKNLSSSVLRLDKGRILMEMNYMMAYGSAEASLRLLWKFGLLEILLPIQAAYFVSQGFRRRDKRSNMLLSLFSSLDNLLAPDRPCHCSLWVAILAFHKALADQPRDPLVIAAFSIAVYCGGSLFDAVKIVRRIRQPHETRFAEVSTSKNFESNDSLINEVIDLAASVGVALHKMTDEHFISQALIEYPQAPKSDMVFISSALSLKVEAIFGCVTRKSKGKSSAPKQGSRINYEFLAMGRMQEVRKAFGRIVFDTLYPLPSQTK
ncbi:hypothetical protein M9H77_10387 [Catharanthus roseus]|uniref:Uncharacterized protein n=1 Tax=Catharanthus roseus TaxID=4058 RepID=A0ACC0C3M0_CATRO|nr:hypothetical protein M9H77_10387 [Catharanthus roseus]